MSNDPSDLSFFLAGEEKTITRNNFVPNNSITSEIVFVRKLPIRLFPRLAEVFNDESKLIGLAVGKEEDWVDSLSDESHVVLLEAAERLNLERFFPWMGRRAATNKRISETLPETVKAAMQDAMREAAKTSPSPS